MRVIECDACGEVLAGADDAELLRRLRDHTREAHPGLELDEEAARELLGREAYTAEDS
jgi:predicted small metal-binding protein